MVKAPAKPKKNPVVTSPSAKAISATSIAGIALSPPTTVSVSRMKWSPDTIIHRVHQDKYAGDQFNPGLTGNARFSPIKDALGKPVPTLYGGSTFECAAMETVFHDVPFAPGLKTLDKTKLTGQVHSQVKPGADLVLADLRSKALRRLGVARSQIIDTEKDQYPITRQWAEAIHKQCPDVQGICWTSRQDDSAQALIVFGDRLKKGVLQQAGESRNLVSDSKAYGELLVLAEQIGVDIVLGLITSGLPISKV
jgi:hypothetical protein